MTTMKKLTGLVAAAHTPFHEDGSLHLARISRIVEHLVHSQVSAIYAVGSTGEGPSLTGAERKQVAEAYVAAARGKLPVIVQVGHNSLQEAGELARHASSIGAAAISATPPSYFKPSSAETLVACMKQIASAAPELPFYYYHIPSLSDVRIDMPSFMLRAGDNIPNFAGIKFTAPTIWEYQACLELDNGRFDCLFGFDEMLLPALSVGARGAIGATYNFAAPIYRRVMAAFAEGDLSAARRAQGKAVSMVQVLLRFGGFRAIKAAMKLIDIDCGPVRLPLTSINDEELMQMRAELDQLGVLDLLSMARNEQATGKLR
jgi:N-acetylneuraminate lyase